MSRAEFLRWWQFHRRNPIDPVSLYQKPAALIAYTVAAHSQCGTKQQFSQYLEMLCPVPEEDTADAIFRSFLS